MGRGKRQRDDDELGDSSHHQGNLMSKLNSSLSASRGPRVANHNNSYQSNHNNSSNKFARQHHHPDHGRRNNSNYHQNNNQQPKEKLPYHVKPIVQPIIKKPQLRPHIESNEFGRQVKVEAHFPNFTLYAKNFVPTIDANPHIEQIRGGIVTVKKEEELERVLGDDAPRMPYRRRRGEVKSVVHWGQRKLMLSEIEFLSLYGENGITVVYAGSAPGTHIPYLSKLFPTVKFVLVDPSDFNVEESDRIVIRKEFMTDDIAREYAGQRTLLISDIRSADFKVMSNDEMEKAVKRDMDWQMQWHMIMQPVAGMYKFRLPWQEGKTEYLDGEIYLPVWGPQTTTEARLIATTCNTREWDNKVYEEQMFYFNNVTRCCLYQHDIAASGLDHCYDCSSEVHILKKYLNKHFRHHFSRSRLTDLAETDVNRKISAFVDQLTIECGGRPDGRNLLNWQKRFGSNIVHVAKEFDTNNLKIVKLSPEELKANADIVRLQNANATRILQYSWESSQKKKLSLSMDGEEGIRNGWCGLAEVVMEDIGWNAGKSGNFGGTHIPVKTAADAWLWGMIGELCGAQEPWNEPPFGSSIAGNDQNEIQEDEAVMAVETVVEEGDDPVSSDVIMESINEEVIDDTVIKNGVDESRSDLIGTSVADASCDDAIDGGIEEDYGIDTDPPQVDGTLIVADCETPIEDSVAVDDEMSEGDEDNENRVQRLPHLHNGEETGNTDENKVEYTDEAITREAQLHSSLFLTEGTKFEMFHQIWQESQVDCIDHELLKNDHIHDNLHKVLVLLCGSGSAYFFCPDLIGGAVSKFQLPTIRPEQHHLSMLVGMMNFHRIEKPKKLHLLAFYTVKGERVTSWTREQQKEKLNSFLAEDFNFEAPARALVLNMNGFRVIDTI